jgi:hypothetical protein
MVCLDLLVVATPALAFTRGSSFPAWIFICRFLQQHTIRTKLQKLLWFINVFWPEF